MSERIRVTPAVNRLLWPRLRKLGFSLQAAEKGDVWREGTIVKRAGPQGRPQALIMGRDKFGHRFGVMVARQLPDGSWDHLDTTLAGLPPSALSYQNQAEAEAVLLRIGEILETKVLDWLDQDPPERDLSVRSAPR